MDGTRIDEELLSALLKGVYGEAAEKQFQQLYNVVSDVIEGKVEDAWFEGYDAAVEDFNKSAPEHLQFKSVFEDVVDDLNAEDDVYDGSIADLEPIGTPFTAVAGLQGINLATGHINRLDINVRPHHVIATSDPEEAQADAAQLTMDRLWSETH